MKKAKTTSNGSCNNSTFKTNNSNNNSNIKNKSTSNNNVYQHSDMKEALHNIISITLYIHVIHKLK